MSALEGDDPAARLVALAELVTYHNRRYHELDDPEISDGDFDALVRELRELEDQCDHDDRPGEQVEGTAEPGVIPFEVGPPPLAGARREFQEETGLVPAGPFIELGSVRNKSGKTVHAWGFRGDCDPSAIRSNTFSVEWPPRSGRMAEFPEVDRAQFFGVEEALRRIHPAEAELVARLQRLWSEGRLAASP